MSRERLVFSTVTIILEKNLQYSLNLGTLIPVRVYISNNCDCFN